MFSNGLGSMGVATFDISRVGTRRLKDFAASIGPSHRVACLLVTSGHADLDALAEACLRFTPLIAVRAGEAVFLDISACSRLYSEAELRARLTTLATRMGFKSRVEIAEHAASALALARFHIVSGGSLGRLPLEALIDVASPFRFDADSQKEILATIKSLKALGIRNIAAFLKLPSESLASRFGKDVADLVKRLRGEVDPAWPGFHPKLAVLERAELNDVETQDGVFDLESLLFSLKGVMDRACARLRGRGERAAVVRIGLDLQSWSTEKKRRREWRIELALPQGTAISLSPIVREHLALGLSREPFRAPVKAIDFEVLETAPGLGAQRDFFSQREEEREAWNALVGRLAHKLGQARVFTATPVERYLPEESWTRDLTELPVIAPAPMALTPARPARLLASPEALRFERLPDGSRVLTGTQRWRVLQWIGPERICGEWWRNEAVEFPQQFFDRDYYQLVTDCGQRLWVYVCRKDAAKPRLFLHGYFD